MNLENTRKTQTILITGASSGIGKAAAETFAAKGWNVCATMPEIAAGESLKQIPNVLVVPLDVRDERSIAEAVSQCRKKFGRIDALLSNAGYGQYGVFEGISKEKIQAEFDVNVFGAMNVLRAVLPEFRANGGGQVLVTSSSGGIYGLPTMTLYITTKFALEGFFESVSYELATQNIVVKLIEPGGVDTNFHLTAAQLSTGDGGIAGYTDFYKRVAATVNKIIDSHSLLSAGEVANAIYKAATDGTSRLRYVVGKDAESIIAARRDKPEQEFRNLIKSEFGLGNTV